ncbi:hypothetical protein KC19_2G283900 [Ceratodon purpureus]|uniref:GH16 domain-containing protein n=1 Tax=Ceratodon purpureus TaxID=3225 RepID=A0A8T0J069_CERPU|nr:hypothetical protein KC19_2G283900 [Ceratodon purpureus]
MTRQVPSIAPAVGYSWNNVFYDDFTGEGYSLDTNFRHPMNRAKWKWDAASNKEIWWEPACSQIVSDATRSCNKPILRVSVWSDWFHRIDRLATKQKFGYGYYESRLRFKGAEGMHSAFWLLPEAMIDDPVAPGKVVGGVEVDVVENRKVDGGGNDISAQGNTAVHWGGYGANHRSSAYKLMALPGPPSVWATFGVLHFEGGMRWYWNGKEVNSVGVWTPMKNSIYFSTEVNESGGWAGNDLSSYGPVDNPAGYIEVDYTGFWEQVSESSQLSEDAEALLYRDSAKEMKSLQERVDHLERRLAVELAELKELVQSSVSATQTLHERLTRMESLIGAPQ